MALFFIYKKIFKFPNEIEPKKQSNKLKIAIPAFLDVIATVFANSGLIYVKKLIYLRHMFLFIKCWKDL